MKALGNLENTAIDVTLSGPEKDPNFIMDSREKKYLAISTAEESIIVPKDNISQILVTRKEQDDD